MKKILFIYFSLAICVDCKNLKSELEYGNKHQAKKDSSGWSSVMFAWPIVYICNAN